MKVFLLSAELLSLRPAYSSPKEKLSLQLEIYNNSFVLCTYNCMVHNTIIKLIKESRLHCMLSRNVRIYALIYNETWGLFVRRQ